MGPQHRLRRGGQRGTHKSNADNGITRAHKSGAGAASGRQLIMHVGAPRTHFASVLHLVFLRVPYPVPRPQPPSLPPKPYHPPPRPPLLFDGVEF